MSKADYHGPFARPAPGERSWHVALALLVIAVLIRMRDFGNPIIHVDEQYYLLVGDHLLHGGLPYIDLWDRKPVGLFLIFAAIRLLPGDGILAYQLVATLFAAATAWLVMRGGVKLGASKAGALAAAIGYLLWLSLLSGRGGQSPVFYNLFVAAAAILTLRLPELARKGAVRAIVVNGMAACLLAGLAIQTKYTPVVEGACFGLTHLGYLKRAGGRWPAVIAAGAIWALLGALPTLLIMLCYAGQGHVAFQAFWFSNFASIAMRRGYPAMKIIARLSGTTAQLLPYIVCAILSWRTAPRDELKLLMFGWLAAALIAFAMIGAFFDHYALPLMAPLAIIAAPVLSRHRAAIAGLLAYGLLLFAFRVAFQPTDAASVRQVAAVMKANSGHECPYVFAGDSVLYLLSGTCVPTRYGFPSTLAYEPERGATGIDEATEVRRIMEARPPVVVTMDQPLAPWNLDSERAVAAALSRDYALVASEPRGGAHLLVYLRRDRRREPR